MGDVSETSVASSRSSPVDRDQGPATSPPEDVESDISLQVTNSSTKTGLNSEPSQAWQPSASPAAEERRPPLPPRPTNLSLLREGKHSVRSASNTSGQSPISSLQSTATTAISRTDIQTQSYQDGFRETIASSAPTTPPSKAPSGLGSIRRFKGFGSSEAGDSASIKSYAPTSEVGGDVESLLGGILGDSQDTSAWKTLNFENEAFNHFDSLPYQNDELTADFYREFDEIPEVDPSGGNEGKLCECINVDDGLRYCAEQLLEQYKSKRKHFLILSSAGKPIYNRHGDDNLTSGYTGIIQTIISFYEGAKDPLKGFSAAGTRFVIMSQGPLYLVAISKLGESDTQLRVQLEALYMQILSTLTLPTLTKLFSMRASTDLRRPLQGTEPLLSALADTFTRGSPPTLLSALECMPMRKSHRQVINDTLLRTRCDTLLYGLIVAGGKLVSVVRPRKHSLHPSDLQLIFNMLFEARGVKAAGGENWIPLCLPGFNKNGYLYMYVSFVSAAESNDIEGEDKNDNDATTTQENQSSDSASDSEIAILLISPSKESFYPLRTMRDSLLSSLHKNNSNIIPLITHSIHHGRPQTTDIIPGTVLRHFLYKSRSHVQFTMPSYSPTSAPCSLAGDCCRCTTPCTPVSMRKPHT